MRRAVNYTSPWCFLAQAHTLAAAVLYSRWSHLYPDARARSRSFQYEMYCGLNTSRMGIQQWIDLPPV